MCYHWRPIPSKYWYHAAQRVLVNQTTPSDGFEFTISLITCIQMFYGIMYRFLVRLTHAQIIRRAPPNPNPDIPRARHSLRRCNTPGGSGLVGRGGVWARAGYRVSYGGESGLAVPFRVWCPLFTQRISVLLIRATNMVSILLYRRYSIVAGHPTEKRVWLIL